MTLAPFDFLGRSLRNDPDQEWLRAALDNLQRTTVLGTADQAAVVRVLAQLLSITPDPEQQTLSNHRQIAGYLGSFGECLADVLAPGRPHAFADVSPGDRPTAVALHTRLREERQFDVIVPILAGASMRHRRKDDQRWLVLATVLESLLRLPVDLATTDQRRLTWYGQQLFQCWLEPGEVAMLVHARWLAHASARDLQKWLELVPERRPFVPREFLAELVGITPQAS